MKTFNITLTGETPLLLHQDNVPWSDRLKRWQKDPENKANSVAGDDRSPAWTWIGSLYHDGKMVTISSDNIMTSIREGGAKCPTGKRTETYKRHTQSGLIVNETDWPIVLGDGRTVPYEPIKALLAEDDYEVHERVADELGFELFAKRARVGQSKHVRVRPRFNAWSASGTITLLDEEMIDKTVLERILEQSGNRCGLGDWRPSAPRSPGSFGRFTAVVSPA